MEISVFSQVYDSYGANRDFSLAGEIIANGIPDFGDAIRELEIVLHFRQDGPPKKRLVDAYEAFHEELSNLPRCTFNRKKGRMVLEFQSEITTGVVLHKNRYEQINPDWVKHCFDELLSHIHMLSSKLKKTDEFDFKKFERYIISKSETIPSSSEQLESLSVELAEIRKQEYSKLDEWQKLGVDWEDFHPSAREILDLPFLWSCSDEFAPNGNDTGADVLGFFQDWVNINKSKSSLIFLDQILVRWEVDKLNPYVDEYSSYTYFQTVVGLAFASCKLFAKCETDLNNIAVAAIDKRLEKINKDTKWEHLAECREKLYLCKDKLMTMLSK